MNVVGYVFSYKDDELARSLESKIQREKIENFCKKHAFSLQKVYLEGESSRADFRPALIEIMNNAQNKSFSKIILYKFNILALEEDLRKWIAEELKKFNIDIVSITETKINQPTETAKKKSDVLKAKVRDLPSLPEVVNKVTELVHNPNSSAAQLSRIISHDSGLTSRVLRMVNSAYYGFPKQISSIQHAITILGFTTIKSLVLSSSIFRIFAPKGDSLVSLDYKKFWKHSLLTAIAAKKIHKHLFFEDDENIFSAAILHDIGKIILDQYDHDNYQNVLKETKGELDFNKLLETEIKYCELTHEQIGHLVSEGWNLPQALSDVIRFHHNPLQSALNKKLTTIVYVGNIISHLVMDYGDFDFQYFDENIIDDIGLSSDDLSLIFSELIQESEELGNLESFFK